STVAASQRVKISTFMEMRWPRIRAMDPAPLPVSGRAMSAPFLFPAGRLLADRSGGRVVEQGGVDVIETFQLLARDLLVDEDLDRFRVFQLVRGEDGEGVALGLGAAGAADPVDVVLGVFGHAVV